MGILRKSTPGRQRDITGEGCQRGNTCTAATSALAFAAMTGADADLKTKKNSFGGKAGPGRPKGMQNKTTTLLKDAILQAAANAGGKDGLVGYLTKQAQDNPTSFNPLLGKVLPLQVTGEGGGQIVVEVITRRIIDAND